MVSLAGDYLFDFLGGQVDLNASNFYKRGYYLEVDNVIHQPSYYMLNASARWKAPSDRYTVALWGKNVTNATVIQNGITQSFGVHQTGYAAPRTYGFTVGYHF